MMSPVCYTSSMRHVCLVDKSIIWHRKPILQLTAKKYMPRRNVNVFRRSAIGGRSCFRVLDLWRADHFGIPATVVRLEYDPNRSSFIALLLYKNNICSYVLCPSSIRVGSSFVNHASAPVVFNIGDCLPIQKIPVGSTIHNLELYCGSGGLYIRAGGSFGTLVRKFNVLDTVIIKLRTGLRKAVPLSCRATLGTVSNKNNWSISLGKAGRSRWLSRRPVVRGVAMNPVDHPHGGGEGKKSKKADPMNIWGKVFKWRSTKIKFS